MNEDRARFIAYSNAAEYAIAKMLDFTSGDDVLREAVVEFQGKLFEVRDIAVGRRTA